MRLHVGDLRVGDEDGGGRPVEPDQLPLADLEHHLADGRGHRLRGRGRRMASGHEGDQGEERGRQRHRARRGQRRSRCHDQLPGGW